MNVAQDTKILTVKATEKKKYVSKYVTKLLLQELCNKTSATKLF